MLLTLVIGAQFEKTASDAFAAFRFAQSLATASTMITGMFLSYFVVQCILAGLFVLSLGMFLLLDCVVAPVDKRPNVDVETLTPDAQY